MIPVSFRSAPFRTASVSRRRMMGLAAGVAGSVAAITSTTMAQADEASPVAASGDFDGDFEGLVEIDGGRKVWVEIHGEGSPAVVVIPGYRDRTDTWRGDPSRPEAERTSVLTEVAKFTRVLNFDRPGTIAATGDGPDDFEASRSEPVPQPRTPLDLVEEVRTVLQATAFPGPYVLAAHSLGGSIARLYASAYPEDVVGMVQVDAYNERLEDLLGPDRWQDLVDFNVAGGSDEVVPLPGYGGDLETIGYGAPNEPLRAAMATNPLAPMPLAVLAHTVPFPIPDEVQQVYGFTSEDLEAVLLEANQFLATLAPRSRFFLASTSGHEIQKDQPELVTEAIRQVVTGVRYPDTWDDLASCCAT